jgi:hypothetical protein
MVVLHDAVEHGVGHGGVADPLMPVLDGQLRSDLLNLVVAKGYLTKLLANEAVNSYIGRHEPAILTHLELVVNTVSMEEAVQQQQEADA